MTIHIHIHYFKCLKRGFNQSEILSMFMSKQLRIPLINGLKRRKWTSPQSKLKFMDRQKNLTNAFLLTVNAKKSRVKRFYLLTNAQRLSLEWLRALTNISN